MKKPSWLPFWLFPVGFFLLALGYAFSVPLRRGARLFEAISVVPQAVLWIVPPILLLPLWVYLATRIRQDWAAKHAPPLDRRSSGSLRYFAELLRRTPTSSLARSRALGQTVRLAVRIASHRNRVGRNAAWRVFEEQNRRRAPEVARFLERHDLSGHTPEEFLRLLRRTLIELEHEWEEG